MQRLRNLRRPLRPRLILLIRKHQQPRITQFLFVQHRRQLVGGRAEPLDVRGVNDEDHCRRIGIIAAPVRPYRGLPTEIPDVEVYVLVEDGFDVEAYCGDCGNDFAELLLGGRTVSGL